MNRADFGHWGASLSADDFARALAAAGVLAAGEAGAVHPPGPDAVFGRLRAALESVEPGGLVHWRPPVAPLPDADMLAAKWREATGIAGRPFRLVIEGLDPADSPTWLIDALGRATLGFASVYVAPWTPPQPVASVTWSWPVDIGLLPDDRSRALGTSIAADLMLETIIDVHQIGPEHEACNLLLLPYDLRDALIHALATPVRASCVVVLGAGNEPWERMRPMLETLVSHARASAIVVAAVPDHQRTEWLGALMQELSQDAGLDVALHRATPGRPPLVVAPEDMLQRTRMGPVIRELEEMAMAMPPDVGAEIADAVSGAFEGADLPEPRFRGLLPTFGGPEAFSPPPSRAERIAEATRSARRATPEPEPRFVHADVTLPGTNSLVTTLERSTTYDLHIDIGPLDPERLHANRPMSEEGLFQQGEEAHTLQVFLTDLRGTQEPLSRSIILPRTGRSNTVTFPIVARDEGDRLEMRVLVTHRGRVLQTLRLRAVVGEPESLSLEEEIVTRTRLDDLAGRTRFDLALVVNHTDAGAPAATAISGERAAIWWQDAIADHITSLRDRLEEIIDDVSTDTALRGDTMRQMLVALARDGAPISRNLRDLLGQDWSGHDGPAHIQIVSATIDAYLPLELVYDLPVPRKDAAVCPDAEASLQAGTCPGCRSRPPAEQQAYVCPLGFWALSKVIERHAFDRDASREVRAEDANYLLIPEPVTGRKSIGDLNRILYAASDRADNVATGTVAETATALARWADSGFRQADDWPAWTSAVQEMSPGLLVLLPHTDVDNDGEPVIEVGDKQLLHVVEIERHHVAVDPDVRPMVLLLGCVTSSLDYPLLKLPTSFRQGGASIVLTTLTTILGRHAGPVARMLVDAMHSLPPGTPRSFGEVAREVRLAALRDGNPMALLLAAYGDAEWQLGA